MSIDIRTMLSSVTPDRLPHLQSVLLAVLAGIAGVAGSFAVASFTPSFVAGPIAGVLVRRLPGSIVTIGILVLGDLGENLTVLVALGLAIGAFALTALAGVWIGSRTDSPIGSVVASVATATVATAGLAYAITRAPSASLAAGVAVGAVLGVADVVALGDAAPEPTATGELGSSGRRRVLATVASTVSIVVGGYLLGSRDPDRSRAGSASEADRPTEGPSADRDDASPRPPDDAEGTTARPTPDPDRPWIDPAIDDLLATARDQSLAVEGLESLVSDQFYEVDINPTDPSVDADSWELTVTGAVDEEITVTYDDVLAMDIEHRFVSLRCVGESLNGKKMDNALWTGVPLADLLEPAGPAEECCVMVRAADGYFEEFSLSALRNGFLAVGMNGEALPPGHGHPARMLIPGHWGEINVKWVTDIEVLTEAADGYWEKRGWHGTGPVNTVAKLHVVDHIDDSRIRVAGHAYAGTRGIDRVEVSTDGGGTWTGATLSDPLPGTDVWRQWAYTYETPGSEHEVVVRATDGTGTLQPRERASAFPSGPSGWVSKTVRG